MGKKKSAKKLPRYPWDEWFEKTKFSLRYGRDFHCAVHGMAGQIRNAASARGIYVSLRISEGEIQVTIMEEA